MDKQEKIVCAAIKIKWFDGYNNRSTEFIGVNYKYIRGDSVYEMFCEDYTFLSEAEGFITSKNRFVDAKEAMEIAIKSGQYPDHQNEINNLEQMISSAKEAEARNKTRKPFDITNGFLNLKDEFVLNYERLQEEVNALKAIAERAELKPEDLY